MRVLVTWTLALTLLALPAMAGKDGAKDDGKADKNTSAATKKDDATDAKNKTAATSKTDSTAKPEASSTEIELQHLRDLLESQAKQIQEQSEQLKAQQLQMQAMQDQLKIMSTANALPLAVTPGTNGAPASADATPQYEAQEKEKKTEPPTTIHIKGITITPGGFLAAESVWRSHALSADVNTPFNAIPFSGGSNGHVSEWNPSARQSRISLRAEGKADNVTFTGYYETDWLAAAVTSNNNESNSYVLRQRQIWGQAEFQNGFKFTAGQMWSLVTETRSGVENTKETPPLTIDAQYNVGFSWARQLGLRVSKKFADHYWLAMSVESPQATFVAHNPPANFLLGAAGNGGGLFNTLANYSFNVAPDIIVKGVAEPGWGHYELFGIFSFFRDRVYPNAPATAGAFNDTRGAGGIGANARVPLFKKKLDVGVHFLAGDGIGRYGTVGLQDVTVRPNGTLAPIRGGQALGTVEWHVTPMFDLYTYVGGEYEERAFFNTIVAGKTVSVGYGSPLFDNSGCNTEALGTGFVPGSPSHCTGDTRNVIEGTIGFWHRLYKGNRGTIQWGPQYSYVVRNTWSGVNGAKQAAPHAVENMVLTSFRYILP
ncbi:MAG: hypothetical protein ACRD50_01310 [Candidatus Acidiferrales bacterium]